MSGVAVAGLAVGLYSSEEQRRAAENAAEGQQAATNASIAAGQREYDLQQNRMYPYLQAGQNALSEQLALMGISGDTEAANRALMESPGYKFGLESGDRSLAASTAARGGMGSGKAMTAATQWGQDYATGKRANRLAELSNLSGVGFSAGQNLGSTGSNWAGNYGNLMTSNANAQGAAGIAGENARQSGILGGAQFGLNLYDYMNRPRQDRWTTDYSIPMTSTDL